MANESPPYTIDAGYPAPPREPRGVTPLPHPKVSNDSQGTATTVTNPPFGAGALITGGWARVVTVVATLAGFGAGLLPWPYSLALAVVAVVCAGLVNALSEVPKFVVGRPLVGATATPALIALGAWLGDTATSLPDGWLRGLAVAGSVLCLGLAGAPVAPGGVQAPKVTH